MQLYIILLYQINYIFSIGICNFSGIIYLFCVNNYIINTIWRFRMPNIKPERTRSISNFLSKRGGEITAVGAIGAVTYVLTVSLIGFVISFVSQAVYPFSYSFFTSPLHSYLPRVVVSPSPIASLIFGAAFTLAIYYFEKNIFYRRFHILIKAGFASIAACVALFISNLLSYVADQVGINGIDLLFFKVDAGELPILFIYYYLLSIPLFSLCDLIRRQIFALP